MTECHQGSLRQIRTAPVWGVSTCLCVDENHSSAVEIYTNARETLGENATKGDYLGRNRIRILSHDSGTDEQALEAFDRVAQLTGGDPQVGRELVSFSPRVFCEHMTSLAQAAHALDAKLIALAEKVSGAKA